MLIRRRFYLVFNPLAGLARDRAVHALVTALQVAGAEVHVAAPGAMAEVTAAAAQAARSGDYDALIACGGDGTVRQIAMAAAGTDCPVAPCMLGTGNVLAHEFGLPREMTALGRVFMTEADAAVSMGRANGEPFLLMAGAGFDGRVIAHLDQQLKQKVAKLAYVPATLKAVSAPPDILDVVIDGDAAVRVGWVIVTSASRYGGAFRLTTRTRVNTPGLVAILFHSNNRLDMIRYNLALALGRLDRLAEQPHNGVTMLPARTVVVTSGSPVPVQVDGDAFGSTPLSITADGPTVRLIGAARPPIRA